MASKFFSQPTTEIHPFVLEQLRAQSADEALQEFAREQTTRPMTTDDCRSLIEQAVLDVASAA